MTSKLPSLMNGLLLSLVLAVGGYFLVTRGAGPYLFAQVSGAGQGTAHDLRLANFAPDSDADRAAARVSTSTATTDGNELVAQAARRVQAEPSVQAQIRFRIDAAGQNLVGNGLYLQLGDGPEKLLRFDLKLQVGQRTAALQQISGQQYFWIRRDLPPANDKVTRVNLRSIRQAIARDALKADNSNGSQLTTPGTDAWLLLGGLPALLEGLHRDFEFGRARAGEIEYPSPTDGRPYRLPVWALSGTWKKERWQQLHASGGKKKETSSQPLPHRVDLVLGRNERSFALFPYRVLYFAPSEGRGGQGGAPNPNAPDLVPMVSMELFNVQAAPELDPRDFDYNPGEQEVEDVTQMYLQRLGLAVGK